MSLIQCDRWCSASVTTQMMLFIHAWQTYFVNEKNLHNFYKRFGVVLQPKRKKKENPDFFAVLLCLLCLHIESVYISQMEIKIAILYIFILMRDNFSRPPYTEYTRTHIDGAVNIWYLHFPIMTMELFRVCPFIFIANVPLS